MTDLSISSLLAEEKRLAKDLGQIRAGINILRELCDHAWKDNGQDSHHRYVICTRCEKEDSR